MADEKILIEGEEYISSGRAAKLVGYTKDYVGQLARDGKITAKRVGRNWYIEEKSIAKHKVTVHYNLTKPKKPITEKEQPSEKPHKIEEKEVIPATPRMRITHEEVLQRRALSTHSDSTHGQNSSDVEGSAFLPQLKKRNRDVLLHSDIRYEHDTNKAHTTRTAGQERKKIGNNFYKEIPIRKPINREIERYLGSTKRVVRKQHGEHEHARFKLRQSSTVDGIIVKDTHQTRPSKSRSFSPPALPTTENTPYEYKEEILDTSQKQKSFRAGGVHVQEERSKVIPVVGSIILFTIVAVVYILFFSAGA